MKKYRLTAGFHNQCQAVCVYIYMIIYVIIYLCNELYIYISMYYSLVRVGHGQNFAPGEKMLSLVQILR